MSDDDDLGCWVCGEPCEDDLCEECAALEDYEVEQ